MRPHILTIETLSGSRHDLKLDEIDKVKKSGAGTKITTANGKSYKVSETVTAVERTIEVRKKWKRKNRSRYKSLTSVH